MSLSHANGAWRELERHYNVVLPDALGHPMLGFRDGAWFAIGPGGMPQPLSVRAAILRYPATAGSIVQVMCWWMREFHGHPRAIDLATELAFTVSELASMAGLPRGARQLDQGRRPDQLSAGYSNGAYPSQPAQQGQVSHQSGYQHGQQAGQRAGHVAANGYSTGYSTQPAAQPYQGGQQTVYQTGHRADPAAGAQRHDPLTSPYF